MPPTPLSDKRLIHARDLRDIILGNITLRDVNLRPDELNEFFQLNKLPVTLKAGFASQMALTVSN